MTEVIIYTKTTCPYCVRAKQLLEEQQLSYQEIKIDEHPEKRAEMIEKSNGRTTVPQIFINGNHRGGCDDLYAYFEKNSTLL
ncbi:MAG: glutaredoxin 3 [Gammaproteobacteria bacterium]|nr:glutaredoxin 3 [Gammaproteobacteria bacterium]